jgi:hypothetical protein
MKVLPHGGGGSANARRLSSFPLSTGLTVGFGRLDQRAIDIVGAVGQWRDVPLDCRCAPVER